MAVDTLPGALRRCETCGASPRAVPYLQCVRCLRAKAKPSDVTLLASATEAGMLVKVAQWHLNHPGWRLVHLGTQTRVAAPTQSTPMGVKLYIAEYAAVKL